MKSLKRALLILAVFIPSVSFGATPRKVGVILPLSGSAASYGEQFRRGLELSSARPHFELIYEDSKFDSKTALAAYEKLRRTSHVDFLVSFGGATCEVLNRAAQRDKLLHIAAGCNTAEFKTNDSYNFRLDVNEAAAAAASAQYLKKEGVKKAAFLYLQNSWAETIIKFTRQAFLDSGLEVSDEVSFTQEAAADVRAGLVRLRNNHPQRIFLIALPDFLPVILRQIREMKIDTPIMSNISVENPQVIALAGKYAEGIIYLSVKSAAESRERYPDFYQAFPQGNPFAAWGHDSLLLLASAAASENPRQTLQRLDGFAGAFNNYDFDQHGELNLRYEIREIRSGKYVTRDPL